MMSEEGRKEAMESLSLDDDEDDNNLTSSKSYSKYRSAMTSLSDSRHPLSPSIVATPADSDRLSAPDSPQTSSIQPPSYADIVFSPLNVEELNGIQNPDEDSSKSPMPADTSPPLNLEYLNITVSDPQKEMESSASSIVPGSNTYVTYLITTKTNLPDYGGSDFSARRRFKDVVILSDRLTEGYRGYFIPPRPDKSVVESQVMQKQEFVEQRRLALEKYLQKLASHPVIKKSDELRVFLQVDGKLPLPTTTDVASRVLDGAVKLPKQLFGDSPNVIGPQDVVQPAKGGKDLLRLFKELKQSVANDWGGSKSPVEEEDKDFLENKQRLHNLELQLSTASKQAESLVKTQQDMGDTIGELGLAFIKLSKFENERATVNTQRERTADMRSVAAAAVKASRLYRDLNSQTVKHLDILHEHLSLMLGIHHAFSDRSSALLTVQTLISELSSLNSRAEKLETTTSKIFGGDKSRVRKLEELKDAIRVTEDAKNCSIREYERIKENNQSEIHRINRERCVDFVNMLKGFVTNQIVQTRTHTTTRGPGSSVAVTVLQFFSNGYCSQLKMMNFVNMQ
ncbi:sorting nexin 2B isoform X3 [Capsicum annuum]|uniref:sorting nexin 2B isoform X3 n=1 Tax=Capsicum annuum TaxID=4072 RepID=UPI001FB13D7C|nr:sorting nexin 2B isoform X3 [Capsicum annuum]